MRYNRQGHNIIHRGLAKKTFKENSIKAFKFCFKKNYGIETDLHTTLDNKIVCYHDFSLKRFKSKKLIKNLKYKDINKIASKYKMHIPTLNEVIKISKKNYLMLEIKSKFTKKNFFEVTHSMSEKRRDCPSCNTSDSLFRVPSNVVKKVARTKKVGDVVKAHIEEVKQEVKEEKERIRKEEYKP